MSILYKAIDLVEGQRNHDYGDIKESFNRIAGFWSSYLNTPINALDVTKMMMLLKISRAKHNNHLDSYIDIAGYVACAEMLMEEQP